MMKIVGCKYCVDVSRRTARKHHVCAKCGKDINPKEQYFQIIWKVDDSQYITQRICLDCSYPTDFVENTDSEIRKAERFDPVD